MPWVQFSSARVAAVQVMITACDTFRSGAVEQLKTHCVRLGVPLYERGYEKDPAKVAFEAQRAAERNKKDVLLVDTAGGAFSLPIRAARDGPVVAVHPNNAVILFQMPKVLKVVCFSVEHGHVVTASSR
jgi:flagellar biosynthesis GTPase FlhF